MVRVAAAQMRVSENMEENYQKSLRLIREAAEAGAKLVCFPEGQLTHYIPQYQGLKSESFAIAPDHMCGAFVTPAARTTSSPASR